MKDKYDVSYLAEGQYEPGSKNRVLKNLLGIKSRTEMEALETTEYMRILEASAAKYDQNHRFTAKDILDIHKEWLGGIYTWAGAYRQVNTSKGFTFAAAAQIPKLMKEFEKTVLARWTPCRAGSLSRDSKALAIVHAELMLIHPFRDGNGRLGRILSTLMALQAGFVPLDFSSITKGVARKLYFMAVQQGMTGNYLPMQKIFEKIIKKTMREYF